MVCLANLKDSSQWQNEFKIISKSYRKLEILYTDITFLQIDLRRYVNYVKLKKHIAHYV